MATIALSDLILQVRSQTDRINDPTLLDSQIAQYVSDGARCLWDVFLDAAPIVTQSAYDFELTANTQDGATSPVPADFQQDLGCDWTNATGANGPIDVRRLPTFQDRNNYQFSSPLQAGIPYYNKNYQVQGDVIRLYPFQSAVGQYRLWYQKRLEEMALPVTRSFAINTADQVGSNGTNATVSLANAAFTSADVGGTITLAFTSTNLTFNGTYTILAVLSGTFATLTHAPFGGSFTNPATGSASVTSQPAGTISTLPAVLGPWQIYIKTFASISVKTRFEESAPELQVRLNSELQRAQKMAQKRDSDLRQIPIVGSRMGAVDSPNYDSGGGLGGDF